jgi:hypothetical protein
MAYFVLSIKPVSISRKMQERDRERETLRKDREPLELSPCPVYLLDQKFSFSSFSGKSFPAQYIKQANLSVHGSFLPKSKNK